jgi:hypothetical protein
MNEVDHKKKLNDLIILSLSKGPKTTLAGKGVLFYFTD